MLEQPEGDGITERLCRLLPEGDRLLLLLGEPLREAVLQGLPEPATEAEGTATEALTVAEAAELALLL